MTSYNVWKEQAVDTFASQKLSLEERQIQFSSNQEKHEIAAQLTLAVIMAQGVDKLKAAVNGSKELF